MGNVCRLYNTWISVYYILPSMYQKRRRKFTDNSMKLTHQPTKFGQTFDDALDFHFAL